MTDLEKYEKVNKCETYEEFYEVLKSFSDENGEIQGRIRKFNCDKMIASAKLFFDGYQLANTITRQYGLRQQAIYLKHYNSYF